MMRRVVVSYLVLLLVGYVDYVTGYEVRFGSIYLLIVALAAWHLRALPLGIYSLVTVGVWTVANRLSGLHYSRAWIVYWNMGNLLGSIAITAICVSLIRTTLDEQHRLIRELRQLSLDARQLRGLMPVCRICDQLRTDSGYATEVAEYLRENTAADKIGGVCPECLQKRAERLASIPIEGYLQPSSS